MDLIGAMIRCILVRFVKYKLAKLFVMEYFVDGGSFYSVIKYQCWFRINSVESFMIEQISFRFFLDSLIGGFSFLYPLYDLLLS